MNKQRTIYHLLVDESGSMSDCIPNTINGYNEQLGKIKSLKQKFPEQEILMGMSTFNDEVSVHLFASDPEKALPLSENTYRPSGSTAMLDAIGSTVSKLEKEVFRTQKISTTVVLVVITDGYENASREYRIELVRDMIKRLEATEKWTFSFIGATWDAVEVAKQMEFREANSFSFVKEEMSEAVWGNLNESMDNYMADKRAGRKSGGFFKK